MSQLSSSSAPAASGIPDSELPGPFAVGRYASRLREQLRSFKNVQLLGELVNLRVARSSVYFELRDAGGAVPCAAWLSDWEGMLAASGQTPLEGMQVVVAGGCDYYPGSATSSPSFSFRVTDLRIAGDGDLLAQIDRLRKQLDAEGLLGRQQLLPRPTLPRTIGVVTGESGKARDDVLAGLRRRGWAGRVVWAFAPVQDRHAAPAITRALGDLAATPEVEVVIVARGGGSLADLLCFCDETLCRTVSMLAVPVIASVGHHTDRTLLDDVAAVSCSTPTHAADAAVPLDCARARAQQLRDATRLAEHARRALAPLATQAELATRLREHSRRSLRDRARHADSARRLSLHATRAQLPRSTQAQLAQRLRAHGRRAVLTRASKLALLSRAPAEHLDRQRERLHQQLREIRAGARRRLAAERQTNARRGLVVSRKGDAFGRECEERLPRELDRLRLVLAGHDPQRTLDRGYVLAQTADGEGVTTSVAARAAGSLRLRFADGSIEAEVGDCDERC
jgi:exodeoxyribonuclease VII large subunit